MWEVGKRLELAQETQRGRGERQEQYEKGAKNMVGLRTRKGEVAACTLVSAVSTGNWGRGGRRSQGPPDFDKISNGPEFNAHHHDSHYNQYY